MSYDQEEVALKPVKQAVEQLSGAVAGYQRAEGEAEKEHRLQLIGGKVNALVKEIDQGALTPQSNPELFKQVEDTLRQLPPEARRSFMVTSPEGFPRHIGDPIEYFQGVSEEAAEVERAAQQAMQDWAETDFAMPAFSEVVLNQYGPEVAEIVWNRMQGGGQ